MRSLRALSFGLLSLTLVTWSAAAAAETRTVGAGKQFAAPCAAIAAAQAGDVIEIDAATYAGDMCQVPVNGLTLRGVGGRAVLDAQGGGYGGKAIWVISGNDVTVENVEFENAAVDDRNGAGIRGEGANLTLRGCSFHDNENGILIGDNADSAVLVESSEFARNGIGDGLTHNMYVNHVKSFTLRASYTHDANVGHLVKSRALENHIEYNRITNEASTVSYEINLPNGGKSFIVGNVIEQGNAPDNNGAIVSYGEDPQGRNPDHDLYVVNNTFVNHRTNGGTFVNIDESMSDGVAQLVNNVFAGPGTVTARVDVVQAGSCTDTPAFVNEAAFDFHLTDASPCKEHGVAPGNADGIDLGPTSQYVHPLAIEGRVTVGVIDSGAFEVGGGVVGSSSSGGTTSGSSGTPGTSGGTSGNASGGATSGSSGAAGASSGTAGGDDDASADGEDDGGCGCHSTPGSAMSTLGLAAIAALLARRRQTPR